MIMTFSNDYDTKIRSNISSRIYDIFRNVQIRVFSCSCTATDYIPGEGYLNKKTYL